MRAQAFPGEDPALNLAPKDIMPTYQYLLGPDSTGVTGQRFNAQEMHKPPRQEVGVLATEEKATS